VEFERVTSGEAPISASRVRALLGSRDWDGIRDLVPDVTYNYLREKFSGD
jgi:citrate lyase synthetase